MIEVGHNAYGKGYTQAQDINQCIDLVFVQVTDGDQEVVSEHLRMD